MQIMLHRQMGQQSIAKEALGKNSRRAGGEGAVTVAAVALLQFIANHLLAHGVHFNNGARFAAFGIQRAAAVRATPRRCELSGGLLALRGILADGVEEPKGPSLAVRSWWRKRALRRTISSCSWSITNCFFRHPG